VFFGLASEPTCADIHDTALPYGGVSVAVACNLGVIQQHHGLRVRRYLSAMNVYVIHEPISLREAWERSCIDPQGISGMNRHRTVMTIR
jgi:hypothetical protein